MTAALRLPPDAPFALPALHAAWQRVQANRGAPGIDGVRLDDFSRRLDHELERLALLLRHDRYTPQGLRHVVVERDGRKPRQLAIPTVADRVVQTAAARWLSAVADPRFLHFSHGYRPAHGVGSALASVRAVASRGLRWVVDADVQDFFGRVRVARLRHALRGWIDDPRVARVIDTWLAAIESHGGGLPLGSPLSPVCANIALHPVDRRLAAERIDPVRYADDLLLFAAEEGEAWRQHRVLHDALAAEGLALNERKTRVALLADDDVRFLGTDLGPWLAGPATVSAPPSSSAFTRRRPERDAPATEISRDVPTAGERAAGFASAPGDVSEPDAVAEPLAPSRPSESAATAADRTRTLYVVTQGARLHRDGGRLSVRRDGLELASVLVREIDLVMLVGNIGITSAALRQLLENDVRLSVLDSGGRCLGTLGSDRERDVDLLRGQLSAAADPDRCLALARSFVTGKLANAAAVVHRIARNHGRLTEVNGHLRGVRQMLEQARHARTLETLRGLEGFGARCHYAALRELVGPVWGFAQRQRRPAPCPVNAMLDFGSALLGRNVEAALRAHGFLTAQGFLHQVRSGHAALASDLMEELRAPVVDSLVIHLCVSGRIKVHDFEQGEGSGCRLGPEARRTFVHAFEARMGHAEVDEARSGYRTVIDRQARHLAAVLRGEDERYRPVRVR